MPRCTAGRPTGCRPTALTAARLAQGAGYAVSTKVRERCSAGRARQHHVPCRTSWTQSTPSPAPQVGSDGDALRAWSAAVPAAGLVLDPVYSGKAMLAWLREVRANPARWSGRNVLFVHTGGLLGMFEKTAQMEQLGTLDVPIRWAPL
jgi:hypothetical protein